MSTTDRIRPKMMEHARGAGHPDEEAVRARAREIGITNGRPPGQYNQNDYDQAVNELSGENRTSEDQKRDVDQIIAWDEAPEDSGKQGPVKAAPDEQTFAEQLVIEGVEEAQHEQSLAGNLKSRADDEVRSDEP